MEENKENKQEQQEINLNNKVKEKVEEKIKKIVETGIQSENVDYLYKLIDIHKDIENEDYWNKKKEVLNMNYRNYGDYDNDYSNYGRRGIPNIGRGRYREGIYGRRGVAGTGRSRYRGYYPMEEMMEHYGNYSEANEESMRGNYGAEGEMVKSVEGIMKNIYEIVEELSETEVPEVEHIIKKYAKKISEM